MTTRMTEIELCHGRPARRHRLRAAPVRVEEVFIDGRGTSRVRILTLPAGTYTLRKANRWTTRREAEPAPALWVALIAELRPEWEAAVSAEEQRKSQLRALGIRMPQGEPRPPGPPTIREPREYACEVCGTVFVCGRRRTTMTAHVCSNGCARRRRNAAQRAAYQRHPPLHPNERRRRERAERRDATAAHGCTHCGARLVGVTRATRRYCGPRCRVAAMRERHLNR
jgi:hypothetical protein